MDQLVSYIKQQINSGYDINAIKSYLISYGYDKNRVEEAIKASQQTTIQAISQTTPRVQQQTTKQNIASQTSAVQPSIQTPDPKLVSYIQEQINNGYNVNDIRQYLISLGYKNVDAAINNLNQQQSKPTLSHHHTTMIITSMIVIASMSIGVFLFFFLTTDTSAPEVLLDFELSPLKNTVNVGENFEFILNLESKGAKKRYDVFFTHSVIDSNNNKLFQKKETVAVETDVSKRSNINIPDNFPPGTYTLNSIGRYNGETVEAEFSFSVESEEEIIEPPEDVIVENPAPIENVTVTTSPTENKTTEITANLTTQPDTPIPPPQTPTDTEEVTLDSIKDEIKQLSSNPATIQQAESKCNALTLERHQDTCYLTIVEVSKQKGLCERVKSTYRKDVCYINNFVVSGDYSVCNSIIDPDLRDSCEKLSISNPAPPPQQEESNTTIEQETTGDLTTEQNTTEETNNNNNNETTENTPDSNITNEQNETINNETI